MALHDQSRNMDAEKRYIGPATPGMEVLGPLRELPGLWHSRGRGWNMIALPVAPSLTDGSSPAPFRVLMNQYSENLKFTTVDTKVPNRGISFGPSGIDDATQFVVTLDYEQTVAQDAADDFPKTTPDLAGGAGLGIHHEPGLWLNMTNQKTNNIDIARLANIPHGNSVLAMGSSDHYEGGAKELFPLKGAIPVSSGLALGRLSDEFDTDPYMAPYRHYIDNPFFGNVPTTVPGFPGFSPDDMNAILRFGHGDGSDVATTTQLTVDSTIERGGVANIPFVEKQADAASMNSTFWIQTMKENETSGDRKGKPKLRLLYTQVVMLDFFAPRRDGLPGKVEWPHISINMLDKLSDDPGFSGPPIQD